MGRARSGATILTVGLPVGRRGIVIGLAAATALAGAGAARWHRGQPAEDLAPTLTQAAFDLFPHPILGVAVYRAIVAAMLRAGGAPHDALAAAVAALDAGETGRWRTLPEPARLARLRAAFAEPGIQALRFATLVGLYDDLRVTRRFGYQGPSIGEGGYLYRGFDDLAWLPAPGEDYRP